MIREIIITGFLFASLSLFNSLALAQEKELILEISQKNDYEVVYHRTSTVVTGILVGGLIGAAVEDGVYANKDKAKRKQLDQYVNDPSCMTSLEDGLKEKLAKGKFNIVDASSLSKKQQKQTHVLRVKIEKCGFKMTDTNTATVASFVKAKAQLRLGNKKVDDFGKMIYVLGKNQYSFGSLLDSKELIQEELRRVLERTGKKIGNKLIYSR